MDGHKKLRLEMREEELSLILSQMKGGAMTRDEVAEALIRSNVKIGANQVSELPLYKVACFFRSIHTQPGAPKSIGILIDQLAASKGLSRTTANRLARLYPWTYMDKHPPKKPRGRMGRPGTKSPEPPPPPSSMDMFQVKRIIRLRGIFGDISTLRFLGAENNRSINMLLLDSITRQLKELFPKEAALFAELCKDGKEEGADGKAQG